jgi:threonine/homoserine/homoserine lactone efflux protein
MAVAITLSPFAVIPAIVLLLTARPRATAGAFLAGWALGVATVTAVAVVAADLIDGSGASPRWVAWARVALGLALLGLGIGRWRARGDAAGTPAWLQGVQSATPARAFVLGVMLSAANPKVLMLALAGGLAIGSTFEAAPPELLGVLAFTAVSSISVGLPLLAFLALRDRAMGVLTRLRAWLEANAGAVMAVVLIVLGAALLASGVAKLA